MVFLRDCSDLSGFTADSGENVGGKMLLVLMVVIGIIANPILCRRKSTVLNGCQLTYISRRYFLLHPLWHVGPRYRDDGTQHKALSWVSAALFATGVFISLAGHYMNYSGAEILPIPGTLLWADGFYLRNRVIDSG